MFRVNEYSVKFYTRAKYYQTPEGEMKLAKVQNLSFPVFRAPGFEKCTHEDIDELVDAAELYDECSEYDSKEKNLASWKNLYRAKMNAFDKILCNPDLDTFATFTISPKSVGDRSSWDDVYKRLKVWLSDRVQRKDLKYVICPERHRRGGIHFHALMNSSALKLIPATNAVTGAPMTHNGNILYNISDFNLGFTSAEIVQSKTIDREKVAKYIFKYMGKQGIEGKIGGRYALMGGKLSSPFYAYGESIAEFLPCSVDEAKARGFYHESVHDGIRYREWSFI